MSPEFCNDFKQPSFPDVPIFRLVSNLLKQAHFRQELLENSDRFVIRKVLGAILARALGSLRRPRFLQAVADYPDTDDRGSRTPSSGNEEVMLRAQITPPAYFSATWGMTLS